MKIKNEEESDTEKKIRKINHNNTIIINAEDNENEISFFFNPSDLDEQYGVVLLHH